MGRKGISKSQMQQMTLSELQQMKKQEIQGVDNEIYILGNPPFAGSSWQTDLQKNDIINLFPKTKKVDYIACWFLKGINFIQNSNTKMSFVTTNSICQGEQVQLVWNQILNNNVEIFFAHQSFKWQNKSLILLSYFFQNNQK